MNRYETNTLQESRFRYAVQDSEKSSKEVRRLERELESYKGGESNRNGFLNTEISNLKRDVERLTRDNQRLLTSSNERRFDIDQNRLVQDNENLNRTIQTQREEFDRTIRRLKEDHQRQISISGR